MDGRVSVMVSLLSIACVWGCDDVPNAATTTAPAPDAGGQESAATGPSAGKVAILAWARAVDAGDVAAAKALSDGDAEQLRALEALVARRVSEARLDAALRKRFPKETEPNPAGGPAGLAAAVERADEMVDGDSVTVGAYVEESPLLARKQPDGQWLVALDGLTRDTETTSRMMARAYEALAAELNEGDYASPEEALDALDTKVAEAAEAMGLEAPPEPPGEAPADAVNPE